MPRTIRPIAACSIYGIAFREEFLWAIDSRNGYLLKIDPLTDNTIIVNSHNWSDFVGATGLAIAGDTLWFTVEETVYFCSLDNNKFEPKLFTRLAYPANGIAIWDSTVYLTCQKTGRILIYNRKTGQKITHFYAPGIGIENITVREEEIWLTDTIEQTVYCLDRATGKTIFSVLTPFESPTGLTFYQDTLYVAYADREIYIRDNPNAEPNHELQYRDRTFIHPLYFHYHRDSNYALSNGYLVEMSYRTHLRSF